MKTRSWKRFGSCLMALAMVLSGTALPASAATPGKDGSAEMNEAYAAHESLMPIGPSFSVATLLEWTPESDPDARYSRASIPMANREGGFVVNPKANPEAKLMLCSLANSSHDTTSSQGTENFMSWSFNYWQYTNSFVYWSGSEEGLICCPTGEFTDAAHTNGVPVVATLGFPWGSGSGYAEEVDAFCQKAEDGSFPVADKLLEVMDYYGFDGYFFNQESFGCSAEIASRLDEMIRYMRAKCPDILISWYDSMLPSGGVSYQNAVNSSNQRWMERSDDGSVGINEFFKYTVEIPAFPEPTAFLNLVATNAKGEKLTGVTYGVYNSNNEKVYTVTTGEPAEVVLGTYTIKCENVPEGYLINDTVVKRLVVTEGQTYDVNVTLQSDSVGPIVTSVTVSPATASVEKGATKQFAAMVNGENITDHSVTWSVDGAVSEATEIDETGLLTVAEDETAEQLTVVATSVQDPNVSGSAAVTVTEPVGELELVSQNATIVGYNGKKLGTAQGPEKLFDGDKENPDTGKWCEDGSNLWVAFDIGEERNVRQLVVSHVGVAETPTAGNGSMNTANYEFYVLNEEKVNVDELLAMEAEERNAVLADAANWTERAKTTDNAADVTTNDLGDATGRIFKLNVSRTDTTGWAACVRIYEAELYATAKPTEPVVDKTILNQLIEQASALVEDDYTTTSWAAFATALAEAQSISAAEDAKQETVNNAADALQDAMESLVKRADNSNLVAAINSIKELDESRYQPDSWAALAQALAEAEKVAANRDATADEIEAAYTNLEAAYKALALRADMTAIDDMISKVEAMDANAHTAKSWKLVADALEAAKTVAANENATQEAVDAAARTLQAAAAALVKAGDATELNALVEETKQLDLSKYTVESADAIRQAISDAEAAIAGRASAEDLKAALDAVRNAVNTAQTKPAAPVQKPADTVKPVQKPADTVKDEHPDIAGGIANGTWGAAPTAKPNDGSAAASGSGATSAIPQTSDNFPYEVLSILACMAVGGFIVALYLKKRRGNR